MERNFRKFNIVLSSSGFNDINNEISEEIVKLFKEISKDKKVLVIANASPVGSGNYIARENVKENFLKAGASCADIIDLDKNNTEKIQAYDIVYGLGGDMTYLIELNKGTNFKQEIIKFLKKGIYVGESAGSMILSEDLECFYIAKRGYKPKYDVVLDTYEGLGLTKRYVFPHHNKLPESVLEKAMNYEKEFNIKFTMLNDGEFITEQYTHSQV